MTGIFSAVDRDILRDATRPMDIFISRVRSAPAQVLTALGFTLLLLLLSALLALGPEGTGLTWLRRELLVGVVAPLLVVWAVLVIWVGYKLLPSRNDRVVLSMRGWVRSAVEPLEEQIRALSDDALRGKRAEFEQRLRDGASLDEIRGAAYACVREASRRARNHRQFECQLIGSRVIENNNIAEMRTGEGKTIVCYAANYMKVLSGLKVHMVTVNDYLVQRDANFCMPIFDLLGVSVGYISSDMETYGEGVEVRRAAYACDITYGTNSEFGFDYLRDNMKTHLRDQVQGKQDFVVVDEVDSILIDEARTPLIISGPAHDDVSKYRVADNVARKLMQLQEQSIRDMRTRLPQVESGAPANLKSEAKFRSGITKFKADPSMLSSDEADMIGFKQYFVVELDRKQAHMTEHGAKAAQAELAIGSFYDSRNMNWPHYLDNALRGHLCYQRDKEYVIQDGAIVIVDEFTGRLMQGRQWSDGLHQAVEAKEKVQIKQETQTLASITLQNLFKLYKHLAGMTGTAMTESEEFMKIYKLEVVAIPTNKPIRRIDYNDKIYKSMANKYDAIVEEIRGYSHNGYPADPWSLYDMLKRARKLLSAAMREKGADTADIQRQIGLIDAALAAFKEGEGDADALEKTYLELAGTTGGRPVLVGTVSVESSERLSEALTRRYGVAHEVLNAKNHAREAEIVAKAGQQHEIVRNKKVSMAGNVTIATNMAGRGTDIVLGPGVAGLGGLHVLGTERHESRRIDNQLRGRCGRQGDPGSSRFFLSLEDDLLKLFMPEWMLKMLTRFGMVEGVPIEARQLTRNIEGAQKKVEERNFGIRKSLLEYDEVPDQQRKQFYAMRQRVVEGHDLSDTIWGMIDDSVTDAVDRFLDPKFAALCVGEWCAQHMGVPVETAKLDTRDWEILQQQVRDGATAELRSSIERVFGEYIDPDVDPEEWDTRGFVSWAAQFGVTLSQRRVKEAPPDELRDQITDAALAKVAETDLEPLKVFLTAEYPRELLAGWAKDKFGVAIPSTELAELSRDDAAAAITRHMRTEYQKREIEYPVSAVIEYARQRGGANENEVRARIAGWANRKYGLTWNYDTLAGRSLQQVFHELRALNESFMREGRLDAEIDSAMQTHHGEALQTWARERFGAVMDSHPLDLAGDLREQLQRCGYEMLRYELTQVERMVVLSTLDSVWKDHMYSMGLLREGIGLRGYAERDPKIEFKREGTRLFNATMRAIRDRVTDLIFKVQVVLPPDTEPGASGSAAQGQSPYGPMTTSKGDATNAGFATAAADREAGLRKQGEAARPQTIKRDEPKVGRNEPCPCGSGKKYKQCHGKNSV